LKKLLGMAQNFIGCDREQLLLMSPSLREWLPENDLAWFVIEAVGIWISLALLCALSPGRLGSCGL
jgi:hypothetical protein